MTLLGAKLGETSPFHELRNPWPPFLDRLDSHPEQAFEEFYAFANKQMIAGPPSIMRAIPWSDREDVIHEIILHCCDNKFRVLKRYQNQGRAFSVWLSFVARNRIISMRKQFEQGSELPEDLIEDRPSVEDSAAHHSVLNVVHACIQRMAKSCRLLIEGAADGLKPRELTRLLGLSAEQNKKASDDLRACRQRLRKLIQAEGLGWDDMEGIWKQSGR